MSFLKSIFKKEQAPRTIKNAKDLMVNDIIALTDSFALPESLRAQQFQVTAVNSYEFEHKTQTEWVLSGNNNSELYLSLDVDDKTYLKFSIKIAHADVESLFDLDEFSTIFDEPGNTTLQRLNDTDVTNGWTGEYYHQRAFCQVGYFHRKDHRQEKLSQFEDEDAGEQFEFYQLLDQDEYYGVELEVWLDGDTDVFLTMYRPTSDIIDMYPGS
ncbi:hypothetical protein [Thalassotalea profundi]|uniref:DUF4178 domain-containing protein n=1 Tax=Thalassotalea profundi TaxID=2036687 RepID=A0ABQ3IMV9_9GAMM|nr:hypothetical protein [Thalassotalea profundi]GHE84258.1 hypothetical protein GCM10011501_11090 [Thalassotalea profundi]